MQEWCLGALNVLHFISIAITQKSIVDLIKESVVIVRPRKKIKWSKSWEMKHFLRENSRNKNENLFILLKKQFFGTIDAENCIKYKVKRIQC